MHGRSPNISAAIFSSVIDCCNFRVRRKAQIVGLVQPISWVNLLCIVVSPLHMCLGSPEIYPSCMLQETVLPACDQMPPSQQLSHSPTSAFQPVIHSEMDTADPVTEYPLLVAERRIFLNFFIFYREAETVDPRSGHPVPQGDSSKSFARFWG